MSYLCITPNKRNSYTKPSSCPFCDGNKNYKTPYYLESKFPFFSPDSENESYGYNYIIIFSHEHTKNLYELSIESLLNLLILVDQLEERLSCDANLQHVLTFQVFGEVLGGTISHGHLQMVGVNFENGAWYPVNQNKHECYVCCDENILIENLHAKIFIPPGTRVPHEIHIAPKKHVGNISDLNLNELSDLASALKIGLRAAKDIYADDFNYHLYIHRSLKLERNSRYRHLHIEILPYVPKPGALGPIETTLGIYPNNYPIREAKKDYLKVLNNRKK